MSWRTVQLKDDLCDQDRLILNLFNGRPVQYIGTDIEFSKHLNLSKHAQSIVLIFNRTAWLSELIEFIEQTLTSKQGQEFYIGINRYCICGNDTNIEFDTNTSQDLIKFISQRINTLGYTIIDSGSFDQDQGKYFNFIQPLTWIYGTNKNIRTQ
jgi:hypothetical protein